MKSHRLRSYHIRPSYVIRGLGILALLILAGVVIYSRIAAAPSSAASGAVPNCCHAPASPYHGPLGVPAVQPRANLAQGNGAAFTADDVIHYVNTHPIDGAIASQPRPTVVQVKFITSKQASDMFNGESIGLPDDASVCVVQLHGSFDFEYGPYQAGSHVTDTAYLVLDGKTGNIVMERY